MLKTANKYIRLEGVRINGADGNIYCDMIWFRDVSVATTRIKTLEDEKNYINQQLLLQKDLLDNLPFPIWLRDNNLDIIYCNKKFAEFVPNKSQDDVIAEHAEIIGTNGESLSRELAKKVHANNRLGKTTVGVIANGNRIAMEAYEIPFYVEQNLNNTYSAGCLIDINELDLLRRNLKRHQTAQLEILGSLGTAFAVFSQNMVLNFYNSSFAELWHLDTKVLDQKPNYSAFLDMIRENRLLPEVPDYKAFRAEEQKAFNTIMEPINDLLHLPNGKTLRRIRAPYPMGGIVFAYEDISDRLAATSAYNALMTVQNEMLANLFDAVLVFGANGRLSFFNNAYLTLWNADKKFLANEPSFEEVLDSQRAFFAKDEDWDSLKQEIGANLLNMTSKTMTLQRNNEKLQIAVANLSDGSLMVTYKKLSDESD